MKSASQTQDDVRAFWDSKPCGSELSVLAPNTREYYLEIEHKRYQFENHILSLLDKIDWTKKRTLEIGTGVGTDGRQIIKRGAEYIGINVDLGSAQSTSRAFNIFGLSGYVTQCSATHLVFPNSTFDVVYSFGVLHHIPDVQSAVAEIHRVVKPNGELLIMLYNRTSINYYIEIMLLRKLFRRLLLMPGAMGVFAMLGFPRDKLVRHRELLTESKSMSPTEWLSRNTDGPDNPYTAVYNRKEAEQLFTGFQILSNEVFFFDYRHWGMLGRLIPHKIVAFIGRRWGWHRVIHARKLG